MWVEVLGYSAEEVVGRWFGDLLVPGFVAAFRERFPIFKAASEIHSEFEMVAKDAQHKWVAFEGRIGYGADGSFKQTHCVLQDITETRRAAEALRASEERSRTLVEQASEGIFVADETGRYVDVNAAGCAMLGYSREEILGRTLSDLIPPDDLDAGPVKIDELRSGQVLLAERNLIRKDGSVLPVEISAKMLPDGRLQGMVRDITERKRSQAELEASQRTFSTLFHTSPDAILITRLSDGHCLELNEAFTALSGYTCEDLRGHHAADVGLRDTHSSRAELSAMLQSGQEVRGFQARLSRKDGTQYTALTSANIVEIDGEQCRLTATTDISELAAANVRIERLNRVYALLSGINQALVHIREPQAIFDEACRVIVEEGGFRMAWVGMLAADGVHVEPAACAGAAGGYLESVDIVLGDERRGAGPVGRAISERRHVVHQDIEHEQVMEPWREDALDCGLRTVASFPLMVNERCVGALTIYAGEPGFFDEEQVELLDELAGDISFALVLSEREELRRKMEARHRSILRTAMDGFWLSGTDGRLLEVNEAYCEMSGYTEAELLSMSVSDLEVVESEEDIGAHGSAIRDENRARFESRHWRKDGSVFEVESSVHYEPESGYFAAFQRDITERKLAAERLARALTATTGVVSLVSETRDPYTAGHQRRVSQLSVAVAAKMGMPEDQVEEIRLAALLHDVGKISIPAEILSKPGKLSPTEFELIKGHSEAGHLIIAGANMEGAFAEIVYQHHERCDGSGYPRGLAGDQLLPGTKVIMVADVVEAMASHRPYRAALGIEAALAEIESGAGSRYDAEVARACARVFNEGGFEFSE